MMALSARTSLLERVFYFAAWMYCRKEDDESDVMYEVSGVDDHYQVHDCG